MAHEISQFNTQDFTTSCLTASDSSNFRRSNAGYTSITIIGSFVYLQSKPLDYSAYILRFMFRGVFKFCNGNSCATFPHYIPDYWMTVNLCVCNGCCAFLNAFLVAFIYISFKQSTIICNLHQCRRAQFPCDAFLPMSMVLVHRDFFFCS